MTVSYLAGGRTFDKFTDAVLFLTDQNPPGAAWAALQAMGIEARSIPEGLRASRLLDSVLHDEARAALFIDAFETLQGRAASARPEDLEQDHGVIGSRMVGVRVQ